MKHVAAVAQTIVSALLLAPVAALHASGLPKPKTTILVIPANDLGYADIPAHGGDGLSMPQLDELTRQGVRISNGYVTSPQCSPSRCGLLMGIYNQRFGHEHNGCMRAAFDAGAKTLAEHLRPFGYATALAAADTTPLVGTKLDGVNLLPFLKGENKAHRTGVSSGATPTATCSPCARGNGNSSRVTRKPRNSTSSKLTSVIATTSPPDTPTSLSASSPLGMRGTPP